MKLMARWGINNPVIESPLVWDVEIIFTIIIGSVTTSFDQTHRDTHTL